MQLASSVVVGAAHEIAAVVANQFAAVAGESRTAGGAKLAEVFEGTIG
jgi:hypothetical protein